jgi:hypothetical protein
MSPTEIASTAVIGGTVVYFHDARLSSDGDGFWTPGASTVLVTLAPRKTTSPVLSLRAGPVRTAVGLAAAGWHRNVMIEPNGQQTIELPQAPTGVLRLRIETTTAFVPAERDPASQDRRSLGAWVELSAQ